MNTKRLWVALGKCQHKITEILPHSGGDFQKWLYMYGVGHPVKLMILRNGKDYLVTDYVIEERPAWAKPE